MQGSFSSRTYNFNTLLGRSSFPDYSAKKVVVPPFQRGYSWEKSHVATFWEDIVNFHRELSSRDSVDTYFLGPIVILPEKEHINLLDGQQRLATATILLSVIRDLARQRGGQAGSDLARDIQRDLLFVNDDDEIYALELSELDQPYFENNVQEDPPGETEKAKIRSHRLMRQARRYLSASVEQLVADLSSKELVKELKRLRNTVAEKIKLVAIEVNSEDEAYLIFETLNDRGLRLSVPDLLLNHLMRIADDSADRKRIRNSWNTLVENLGHRKVSTFLRHMWVSRYGDVKRQGLFREIREYLQANNIDSLEFSKWCAEESEQYTAIIGLDNSVLQNAYPHVEGLMKYLSADRALPVLLSGLICLDAQHFEKLTKSVVSLIVRHSILANLNPNYLEDTLYAAARAIRAGHSSGASSAQCLQIAKEILQKLDPSKEQIETGIGEVYLTKKQTQYLLRSLAQKKQSSTKAIGFDTVSIEHIFPENSVESEWLEAKDLESYIWHIGNLTLLEPAYNRSIGNQAYEEKREVYLKSEIVMTNEIASQYEKWGVDEILDRAQRLVSTIEQVWSLS